MLLRSTGLTACAVLLGHCSGEAPLPPVPSAPTSGATETAEPPASTAPSRPDEGGMPEPVLIPAVEAACKEAPCSGPAARIQVIRSGARITAYLHHGDPSSCSHPPSVYFDRDGKELGSIAMRPIVPGSDDAKRVEAEHERFRGGGKPVEEVDCSGRVRPR